MPFKFIGLSKSGDIALDVLRLFLKFLMGLKILLLLSKSGLNILLVLELLALLENIFFFLIFERGLFLILISIVLLLDILFDKKSLAEEFFLLKVLFINNNFEFLFFTSIVEDFLLFFCFSIQLKSFEY